MAFNTCLHACVVRPTLDSHVIARRRHGQDPCHYDPNRNKNLCQMFQYVAVVWMLVRYWIIFSSLRKADWKKLLVQNGFDDEFIITQQWVWIDWLNLTTMSVTCLIYYAVRGARGQACKWADEQLDCFTVADAARYGIWGSLLATGLL